MQVLFDHVGYEPGARKLLLLEAAADTNWTAIDIVRRPTGEQVLACEPTFVGAVDGWSCGPWWSVDASELGEPGRYALAWRAGELCGQSEAFTIGEGVHGDQLVSDIVHYMKGQRCSGIWDRADRAAPRVGDGERRDVHGGWYDASGDYSKYLSHLSYANFMNPQQTPLVVWMLSGIWHRYAAAGAPALLLERIRDEALHGADFLVRMQDPAGFWYVTVFDAWSKDPEQRELCSYRTQLGIKGEDYQAGWRQGGGVAAAALALASTLGDGVDHSADEYRAAALRGLCHLQQHGLAYLDDGHENIIDDTCALLAAAELAAIFGDDAPGEVISELAARATNLIGRRRDTDGHVWLAADDGERAWFHASDEGLPGLALLRLAEASRDHAGAARDLVAELVQSRIALDESRNNPFGYPPHWVRGAGSKSGVQWFFPHDNESGYWWQGENARVASLATLLLAAAEAMPDRDWASQSRDAARGYIAWILGRNPFDVCMLQGHGRNNPPYHPGFHNAPGGVCNGVTSGFDDETDVAFRPMPWAVDKEHIWRWGEQWMPHAAWLMPALVLADGSVGVSVPDDEDDQE
jgi:hypothetical protein